jgi:hypothetical protein
MRTYRAGEKNDHLTDAQLLPACYKVKYGPAAFDG